MVKINGVFENEAEGKSILDYILSAEYNINATVVEINGKIISKSHYSETIIKENDVIEAVSFVGGG